MSSEGNIAGLSSASPTERAHAAAWLLQHPFEVSTPDLMRALQFETVPRLRKTLNEILESRHGLSTHPLPPKPDTQSPAPQIVRLAPEFDVTALIRHELSPAIGWIRLAADREIPDFSSSETSGAVRKLQRRLDGLVALVKETQELDNRRLSLSDALLDSWPHPNVQPEVSTLRSETAVEIETDEGLFSLLLANAYQNAIDASTESEGTPKVTIAWGFTAHNYWARINNPFQGNRFTIKDVSTVGRSSKVSHNGHGLALMQSVANRLGIAITLEGANGMASFSLSGSRPND